MFKFIIQFLTIFLKLGIPLINLLDFEFIRRMLGACFPFPFQLFAERDLRFLVTFFQKFNKVQNLGQ